MMARKGVKFEEKSDFIRVLNVPLALITLSPPPQSIWRSYTYEWEIASRWILESSIQYYWLRTVPTYM